MFPYTVSELPSADEVGLMPDARARVLAHALPEVTPHLEVRVVGVSGELL